MKKVLPIYSAALVFLLSTSAHGLGQIEYPIPPQDSPHGIFKIYGAWNSGNFHNGIDFPGPITQEVRNPVKDGVGPNGEQGGYILFVFESTKPNPLTGQVDEYAGRIGIGATADATEGWVLWHIAKIPKANWKVGAFIPYGARLGRIADAVFQNTPQLNSHDHVHLGHGKTVNKKDDKFDIDGLSDPLESLTVAPPQQPEIDSIAVVPDDLNNTDLSNGSIPNFEKFQKNSGGLRIIYNDIDILAAASTEAAGLDSPGVKSIGYSIENSAGDIVVSERTLADFKGDISTQSNFRLTYKSNASSHSTSYFQLTHCGDDNSPDFTENVIRNAWQTKVRDGEDDDDELTAATGSTGSDEAARVNAEAQYPDGKYTIHVKAEAHNGKTADKDMSIIIDNFAPFLRSISVGGYSAYWPSRLASDTSLDDLEVTANALTGVASPWGVTLGFSEAMDTRINPTVTVASSVANGGEWSANGETYTTSLTFSGSSGRHVITVGGARDLAGNELDGDPKTIAERDVSGNFIGGGLDQNHAIRVDAVPPTAQFLGWYGATQCDGPTGLHGPGAKLLGDGPGIWTCDEFDRDDANFISGLAGENLYQAGDEYGLPGERVIVSRHPFLVDRAGNVAVIETVLPPIEVGPFEISVFDAPWSETGVVWTIDVQTGGDDIEATVDVTFKWGRLFNLIPDWKDQAGKIQAYDLYEEIPAPSPPPIVRFTGVGGFRYSFTIPQVAVVQSFSLSYEGKTAFCSTTDSFRASIRRDEGQPESNAIVEQALDW